VTPGRGAVAALVLLSGCTRVDYVVEQEGACSWGSGAPVLLDGTCTGVLAQRMFGRAVCACDTITILDDFITDGFDSRVGPWVEGGAGGDVGANAGLTSDTLLDVGGSLAVSGADVSPGTYLRVAGDLAIGGPLDDTSSAVTAGGSAWIAGDVRVSLLSVAGVLTTPPGARLSGRIEAGSTVTGAVTVSPACPCGAADAVDVGAIVARHQATNDDASIHLAPTALSGVTGRATVELPCGRFYLDRIQGTADVTIRATGNAALFVGGPLALAGSLTIALAPGAELDLFVAGALSLPANVELGDPDRPRALRVWLATNGTVVVPSDALLAANLYAPAATLSATTPVDLYGALMVGALETSAPVEIHHDLAIAAAAATCGR
jgi:hypothetical protein